MEKVEKTGSELTQVYELGINLIPTIAEGGVGEQFQLIKSVIEKEGGVFVDEQIPQLIDLAYTMDKHRETGYDRYDTAYFGWVKFEIGSSALEVIKEELESIPSILRTLLIKATRENTMIGSVVIADEKEKEEAEKAAEVMEVTEVTEGGDIASSTEDKKEEVSEEAIEKGIEDLVGDETGEDLSEKEVKKEE